MRINQAILTSLSSGAAIDAAIGPNIGLGELTFSCQSLSDYSAVHPAFLTPRFSWSEYIYGENNVKLKDGTFSTLPTGF